MMIDTGALRSCFSRAVVLRSIAVSVIVGTVLNMINQGDAIFAGSMPVIWKIVLTYVVPFLVATYGAYAALAARSDDPPN